MHVSKYKGPKNPKKQTDTLQNIRRSERSSLEEEEGMREERSEHIWLFHVSEGERRRVLLSDRHISSLPLPPPHLLFFYLNVSPLFPFPPRCSLTLFLLSPHLTSCILSSVCLSPTFLSVASISAVTILFALCPSFFYFFRHYEEWESSCQGQDVTLAYSRDRERMHTLTVKYKSN